MILNKTCLPFISEKQLFLPFSNEYFSTRGDKVIFKVPGYTYSQSFQINTVGLSGIIAIDLENKHEVPVDKLYCRDYIP